MTARSRPTAVGRQREVVYPCAARSGRPSGQGRGRVSGVAAGDALGSPQEFGRNVRGGGSARGTPRWTIYERAGGRATKRAARAWLAGGSPRERGGQAWFVAANRELDEPYERLRDRTVDEMRRLLEHARSEGNRREAGLVPLQARRWLERAELDGESNGLPEIP